MTLERNHLTEDEFDEVLMGTASPDLAAHLKQCSACTSHLENFNATMASFNHAAMAWSEAKSNALSRDLRQHRTPFRLTAQTAWACASMVVIAAMVTVGIGLHYRSESVIASQADVRWAQHQNSTSPEENARNEIAGDDAMLRQIDAAINSAEPSPDELYGSTGGSGTAHAGVRRAQVKD